MSRSRLFLSLVLIYHHDRSHAGPFVNGVPSNSHKSFANMDADLMWDEWSRRCLDGTIVGQVSAESLVGFVLPGFRPADAPPPIMHTRRVIPRSDADVGGSTASAHTVTTTTVTTTKYYGDKSAGGSQ